MVRNRSATNVNGEGTGVATVNGRAQRVPRGEPAAPAAAVVAEPKPDTGPERPAPSAAAKPAAAAAPRPVPGPREVVVHIEVIRGGYTHVKVPVAICPRYQGMALGGPAKAFDRQLDSWLTRTVDLGMIGSGLGQIFPVHLQRSREAGRVEVDALILAGMGDPGDFAADDLRYMMSNVTVAVKSMGHDHFSTMLIGTRRNELTLGQAVHGFLKGVIDGYERFRVIADSVTFQREHFQEAAERPCSSRWSMTMRRGSIGSSRRSRPSVRSARSPDCGWRSLAATMSNRTRNPSRMPPTSTRTCR